MFFSQKRNVKFEYFRMSKNLVLILDDWSVISMLLSAHVVHYLMCWYMHAWDKGGCLIFWFNQNCWHLLTFNAASTQAGDCVRVWKGWSLARQDAVKETWWRWKYFRQSWEIFAEETPTTCIKHYACFKLDKVDPCTHSGPNMQWNQIIRYW